MKTRYITVRLTFQEAEGLLQMAWSGDYNNDEGAHPEIQRPSNRAEAKIVRALNEAGWEGNAINYTGGRCKEDM